MGEEAGAAMGIRGITHQLHPVHALPQSGNSYITEAFRVLFGFASPGKHKGHLNGVRNITEPNINETNLPVCYEMMRLMK